MFENCNFIKVAKYNFRHNHTHWFTVVFSSSPSIHCLVKMFNGERSHKKPAWKGLRARWEHVAPKRLACEFVNEGEGVFTFVSQGQKSF